MASPRFVEQDTMFCRLFCITTVICIVIDLFLLILMLILLETNSNLFFFTMMMSSFSGNLLFVLFITNYNNITNSDSTWVDSYRKLNGKADVSNRLVIDKRDRQTSAVCLSQLPPCLNTTHIILQGTAVTSNDVAQLKNWAELEHIEIIDADQITDASLKQLKFLPKLQALTIINSSVTHAGINYFSGHPQLRYIHVQNLDVLNQVNEIELNDLPQLESAQFECPGLNSLRLNHVPNLATLTINTPALTTVEINHANALVELQLQGTRLTHFKLQYVPQLKMIDLRQTLLKPDIIWQLRQQFFDINIVD